MTYPPKCAIDHLWHSIVGNGGGDGGGGVVTVHGSGGGTRYFNSNCPHGTN